jgi:hypothetical protein
MQMKTTALNVLLVLASCLFSFTVSWANTQGYRDWEDNTVTELGVLGAEVLNPGRVAVHGVANASAENSTAGYFENFGKNGVAVYGNALGEGTATGGEFWTWSPNGNGVVGRSLNGKGKTYGGWFRDISEAGTAVHGEAGATSDTVTYGGHFESASKKGVGVYGLANSKTGKTYGGHFLSDSNAGTAVYGAARALVGETYGGYFRTYSSKGIAVYGWAQKNKAGYSGVGGYFTSDGKFGTGVIGNADGTGVIGNANDTRGVGVLGSVTSLTGLNYGVLGASQSSQGFGVYSDGNMKCTGNHIVEKNLLVKGNQTVNGTKSAVVKLKNGDGVSLYAVEASENWFEDFGAARLKDGAAVVAIDPVYAETVNTEIDYHVFLTPRGKCKGLYVTNQKGNSFEVRELNGGKSDISFSYRIVAKRKGYEDLRLAKAKEEVMSAMAAAEGGNGQARGVVRR